MWQKFTLRDVRIIGHYLGVLIVLSSAMYFIPFVVGLSLREWEPASRYLLATGASLIVGLALCFLDTESHRLTRQQALAVTGLVWIVLAVIAALPLYGSGHYATFMDAFFDGVSGLTTTGATVICDLDHLSYADNTFRFMMHFAGGIGLIVVAMSLGLFGKGGGASLYSAEARTEHVVPNVVQTTRVILRISLLFILVGTAVLTLMCLFAGFTPIRAFFNALWLAISGFVTGGFTPMGESVLYYHSFGIELVLMLLMLCGAINFTLHLEVWNGRLSTFVKDLEIRTMVLWLVVIVLVFSATLSASTTFSGLPGMLRRGLFMIVASFTTTGFQNITQNELTTVFTSGAFLVLAVCMAVGGGVGSTAGGIKLNRVGIMAKSIVANIKQTLAPDSAYVSITYYHLGRRRLASKEAETAMSIFMLYVVTYTLGALAGIAHDYDALQAMFESVAMASNGGIVTGIVSPGMPVTLELVYILEMWAGRLEFITFMAIIVKIVVSLIPRRRVTGKVQGA